MDDDGFTPCSYWLEDRVLHLCFNIKNYNGEIGLLLDWLSPYVESMQGACVQYEECDAPKPIVRGAAGILTY